MCKLLSAKFANVSTVCVIDSRKRKKIKKRLVTSNLFRWLLRTRNVPNSTKCNWISTVRVLYSGREGTVGSFANNYQKTVTAKQRGNDVTCWGRHASGDHLHVLTLMIRWARADRHQRPQLMRRGPLRSWHHVRPDQHHRHHAVNTLRVQFQTSTLRRSLCNWLNSRPPTTASARRPRPPNGPLDTASVDRFICLQKCMYFNRFTPTVAILVQL